MTVNQLWTRMANHSGVCYPVTVDWTGIGKIDVKKFRFFTSHLSVSDSIYLFTYYKNRTQGSWIVDK